MQKFPKTAPQPKRSDQNKPQLRELSPRELEAIIGGAATAKPPLGAMDDWETPQA